jgi:hypothetical protein
MSILIIARHTRQTFVNLNPNEIRHMLLHLLIRLQNPTLCDESFRFLYPNEIRHHLFCPQNTHFSPHSTSLHVHFSLTSPTFNF